MNAVTDKPVAEKPPQSVPDPAPGQSPAAQSVAAPPATPIKQRRRSAAILRPLIAVVVLIGAVVTANWWLVEGRYLESTDNAYVQGDIAVLTPRVEGIVRTIHVADNQAVKAGDPLITLDPADRQAMRDQAAGALAEAQTAAATARRQVEQARVAIDSAEAGIAQAKAEAERASVDAGRSGALVGAGWTSRQANDLAVATTRKADAALTAAQAQKRAAEEALGVAQAQVVQADAKIRSMQAALQLAENNLSYTVIRAPFDGIVGNRAAQLGQDVTPGQQLIAVAPPPEQLFVVANFKETQLRRMLPGQKVRLVPDIDSSRVIEGRLDSIAPATGALFSLLPPENATGNFTKVVQRVPVKLTLDPGQAHVAGWLRAGLSVTAEVDTRGEGARRLGLFGTAKAALGLE
jgi:membrane fusion protein (multidrug efflux system)